MEVNSILNTGIIRPTSAATIKIQLQKSPQLKKSPSVFDSYVLPECLNNMKMTSSFKNKRPANSLLDMVMQNQLIIKEGLYDNNLQLKNDLNTIKHEYSINQIESLKQLTEMTRKNRILEEVIEQNKLTSHIEILPKLKEMSIVANMKTQFKELKSKYKLKVKEVEEIKKTLRSTKIAELKLENKYYHEEFIKQKESLFNQVDEQARKIISLENDCRQLREISFQKVAFIQKLEDDNTIVIREREDLKLSLKTMQLKDRLKTSFNSRENRTISIDTKYKDLDLNKLESTKLRQIVRELIHTNNQLERENKVLLENFVVNDQTLSNHSRTEDVNGKNVDITQNLNFTDEQMKEFTYIIIKNLEATHQNDKALKNILIGEKHLCLENEDLSIRLANKLINLLKIRHINDKTKIMVFCNVLYNLSSTNNEKFLKLSINLFKSIKSYSKEENEFYYHKIRKEFTPHIDYIVNTFKTYDKSRTGIITFASLRKVIENINYQVDSELIDFLIYLMKRNTDPKLGLEELKYNVLLDMLDVEAASNLNTSTCKFYSKTDEPQKKSSLKITKNTDMIEISENTIDVAEDDGQYSEINSNQNNNIITTPKSQKDSRDVSHKAPEYQISQSAAHESDIELTQEEFDQRCKVLFGKFAKHLIKENLTVRKFLGKDVFVHEINSNEKYEAVFLQKVGYTLNEMEILRDSIDVYCFYMTVKFNEEYETIDVLKLIKELEKYKVFQSNLTIVSGGSKFASVKAFESENNCENDKTIDSNDLKNSFDRIIGEENANANSNSNEY